MTSFDVDGAHVDLHPGEGPWLLLVHGFLSSRAQWKPNLAGLSRFCRPVTLELLGHGRSASPSRQAAYSVEAYVRRFEALRARLDAETWLVCGQSFGAGLTLRYALEHPNRLRGQIFTNTMAALSRTPPGGAPDARADALLAGGRPALEAQRVYPRPSSRLPRESWEDLVSDARRLTLEGVAASIRTTIPELAVVDDLARISAPTLLVNGVREARFQPLRDMAVAEIPGLEVLDLPGGHSVNIHCPDAFNAAVRDFLGRN